MCGRVKQANDLAQYFDYTKWNPIKDLWREHYRHSPNVPPATRPLVLHRLGDSAEQVVTAYWHYLYTARNTVARLKNISETSRSKNSDPNQ